MYTVLTELFAAQVSVIRLRQVSLLESRKLEQICNLYLRHVGNLFTSFVTRIIYSTNLSKMC